MSEALLLVDIQNDFLPGGALGVPDGDAVVPVANALMPIFEHRVASQDWHPPDHGSFATQHRGAEPFQIGELDGREQILWPEHCVQQTPGAGFASALEVASIDHVVRKGTDARIDSYSAFYDNDHRKATGLTDHLRTRGIDTLIVVGLAADVCVKFTVLDALAEGFGVWLVRDGIRGVDMATGDTDASIDEMQKAGAELCTSGVLLARA
ncbi:bifunctional nicotinamidase/pyrazinamidase [Salinisphaera orenii]|uniref:bifunctional nicotinamidase/pyrazinamidase n=1 Tax=Salinisphaera orenii TaxID=856731 RepID=UPI000DBE0D42